MADVCFCQECKEKKTAGFFRVFYFYFFQSVKEGKRRERKVNGNMDIPENLLRKGTEI